MDARALPVADVARRRPPAAWEAYFLIGVFPEESPLRWCKVQIFSGGRLDRHCLAALEGMDGPGRAIVLLGRADRVDVVVRDLGALDFHAGDAGWDVCVPGIRWSGDYPELSLLCEGPPLEARTRSRDVLWWIDLPRFLSYYSSFGRVDIAAPGEACAGLGVVEHAWGADTHLDVARLPPRRWHWDVLWLGGERWCAGLSLGLGATLVGMGGGRLDEATRARCLCGARWLEWSDDPATARPLRWTGWMRFGRGELRYEARAATPAYPAFEGGGFMGFDYEGACRLGRGPWRDVRGTGFCEYRWSRRGAPRAPR